MANPKQTLILTERDIEQKINRIAYQILEENYDEREIILIGVKENGFVFAKKVLEYLSTITDIQLQLYSIAINKDHPNKGKLDYDFDQRALQGKSVILVDDVANTGRTLGYALKPLLDFLPKKIQVAVLVDRQHKLYPVSADFVGLSLSTTLKEHITVVFGKEEAVYLS